MSISNVEDLNEEDRKGYDSLNKFDNKDKLQRAFLILHWRKKNDPIEFKKIQDWIMKLPPKE